MCGRGKPASIRSSRRSSPRGDCAPGSSSSSTASSWRRPRAPRWHAAISITLSTLKPVARASASSRATALRGNARRPMSKAVRSGVVTARPARVCTSPSSNTSRRVSTLRGARGFTCMSSTGTLSSIHFAPCSAAAVFPAMVPRRSDHSQAADDDADPGMAVSVSADRRSARLLGTVSAIGDGSVAHAPMRRCQGMVR